MSSALVEVFLGAVQASVSVLLTVFYGVIATQFDWLDSHSASRISRVCVRMFLPALLIHNVGSQLHVDTALRYVPIIAWAAFYTFTSMALGLLLKRYTRLPQWVTPALAFNNTTSLPLLLVQSLNSAGVLSKLLTDPDDTTSDALDRAKSYFLVNAVVGNMVTFALGPRLLDTEDNEPAANGQDESESNSESEHIIDEDTSLLPRSVVREYNHIAPSAYKKGHHRLSKLPPWTQTSLDIAYDFLNAPLIGAVLGATIGLTPPLHKLFFNKETSGGYLNAWLATSIKNIGDLFAALQVVVVGVKLSDTLRRMKNGQKSGKVPWASMIVILSVRFVIWPVLSVGLIYLVVSQTGWLSDDPVLWFAMMLMPTGPPAMKLTALADVSGADEEEKMSIAKFLTISYAVSPVLAFTVVAALKATQAVG